MATKKPAAKKVAPKAKAKPVKKAAPAKKAPAKKAAPKAKAKPVKKVAPAKKAPAKKVAPKAKAKPVKKAAPAKKAAPVKAAKKVVAPVKKVIPVVKPAVAAKAVKVEKKAVATKIPTTGKAIAKNPKDIKIAPAKAVVLPKISTKTARKYQPDFTKSVLDSHKSDPGAPLVRYTDTELMEFKELIQRKLEAAKKELNYLQGLITRKDDMGGDESENRYMTMEDGSLSMEREQLSQMASRQITFIDHLEKALMRIENKTYGICRVTGKLIDKARLRAVPHATLSIEAKMGIVK
jgi:RNA polymerase-binding transcription factor DksA